MIRGLVLTSFGFLMSVGAAGAERTIHFSGHVVNYRMYETVTQDAVDNNVACSIAVTNSGPSNSRQCLSVEFFGYNGSDQTVLVPQTQPELSVNSYPPSAAPAVTGNCNAGETQVDPGGSVQFQFLTRYLTPALKTAICSGRITARDADANVPGSVVASGAIANIQEEKVLGGVLSGAFFFSGGVIDTSSAATSNDLASDVRSTLTNNFQSTNMNVYCERSCRTDFGTPTSGNYNLYNVRLLAYHIYRFLSGRGNFEITCSGLYGQTTDSDYPTPSFCAPNEYFHQIFTGSASSNRPFASTSWGDFVGVFAQNFYSSTLVMFPTEFVAHNRTNVSGSGGSMGVAGLRLRDIFTVETATNDPVWMTAEASIKTLRELFQKAQLQSQPYFVARSATVNMLQNFPDFPTGSGATALRGSARTISAPSGPTQHLMDMILQAALTSAYDAAEDFAFSSLAPGLFGATASDFRTSRTLTAYRNDFCRKSCGGGTGPALLGYTDMQDSDFGDSSNDGGAFGAVFNRVYNPEHYLSKSTGKDELLRTASPAYGGGVVKELILGAGYEICNANESSQLRKAWANPISGDPFTQKALYCSQRDPSHEDLFLGSADSHSFSINGGNAF